MSVICCRVSPEKIDVAADSITIRGYTQNKGQNAKTTKLFKTNGMIVGSSGVLSESGMFNIYCQTRTPKSATCDDVMLFFSEFIDWKKKRTGEYQFDNSYIFVFCGVAFSVFSDFCVYEIAEYDAIGAGMDFALAALSLGHTAQKAIDVACELSVFCEKPVICYTIKPSERRDRSKEND